MHTYAYAKQQVLDPYWCRLRMRGLGETCELAAGYGC